LIFYSVGFGYLKKIQKIIGILKYQFGYVEEKLARHTSNLDRQFE